MTEPVSQETEAQKILFWTDKRPVAPDLETRITCAIAEMGQRAYSALVTSISVGIIFQFLPGRGIVSSLEGSSFDYFGYALFGPILIIFGSFLSILIGPPLGDRSDLHMPTYQSGIPQQRTRISRALFLAAALLPIGFLIHVLFVSIDLTRLKGPYFAELLGVFILLGVSSHAAAAIERVRWILQLRAEQGHVLAFGEEGEDVNKGSKIPWYRRATR
jgi:hypothetical protein